MPDRNVVPANANPQEFDEVERIVAQYSNDNDDVERETSENVEQLRHVARDDQPIESDVTSQQVKSVVSKEQMIIREDADPETLNGTPHAIDAAPKTVDSFPYPWPSASSVVNSTRLTSRTSANSLHL